MQNAGTIAGSLRLSGNTAHPNPYANQAIFPTIRNIARTSFVNGTIDIFRIVGWILAAGAILALVLIRKKDMYVHRQETPEPEKVTE